MNDELKGLNRDRKSVKLTEASYTPSRSQGSTTCKQDICKKRMMDNYRLKDMDKKVTIAAALSYRQMLCLRAFCLYTQHFFANEDFKSQKKLALFLYQLVPRFVSVLDQCSGQMLKVRDILAIREEKAWKLFENVIPTQDLAYLFLSRHAGCFFHRCGRFKSLRKM